MENFPSPAGRISLFMNRFCVFQVGWFRFYIFRIESRCFFFSFLPNASPRIRTRISINTAVHMIVVIVIFQSLIYKTNVSLSLCHHLVEREAQTQHWSKEKFYVRVGAVKKKYFLIQKSLLTCKKFKFSRQIFNIFEKSRHKSSMAW